VPEIYARLCFGDVALVGDEAHLHDRPDASTAVRSGTISKSREVMPEIRDARWVLGTDCGHNRGQEMVSPENQTDPSLLSMQFPRLKCDTSRFHRGSVLNPTIFCVISPTYLILPRRTLRSGSLPTGPWSAVCLSLDCCFPANVSVRHAVVSVVY